MVLVLKAQSDNHKLWISLFPNEYRGFGRNFEELWQLGWLNLSGTEPN
jgi:hypothetical protein